MNCRHCQNPLTLNFIDLGSSPPSNAYLTKEGLHQPELWFPLRVSVCEQCWLVQTEDFTESEKLFDQSYAYFSSYSTTWLEHAKKYVTQMVSRFGLNSTSMVCEIAANDGYLLQFVKGANIPCFGVEPTAGTAAAARKKGLDIIELFFGTSLAKELVSQDRVSDLIVANNVLAHVPDINDFVSGIALLLKPNGVATFEFPHLLNLVRETQFDTIYHEHFSYLSLTAVNRIFEKNGLVVFDVEKLPTHGGSLRVYAQRADRGEKELSASVKALLNEETTSGMNQREFYIGFQAKAEQIKADFLRFLLQTKASGKKVVAYGAAAKGNTLLNFAGVRSDLIQYAVDRNPNKQGKFLPGSRIAIVDEDRVRSDIPDYVVILPWNLKAEISEQLKYIRSWGGKFVTAIPQVEVW